MVEAWIDVFVAVATGIGIFIFQKSINGLALPALSDVLSLTATAITAISPTLFLVSASTLCISTLANRTYKSTYLKLLCFCLHTVHALHLLVSARLSLVPSAFAATVHMYQVSAYINGRIIHTVRKHIYEICAVDGFKIMWGFRKDSEVVTSASECVKLEKALHERCKLLRFDGMERYFVLRDVFSVEWRSIAGITSAKTLVQLSVHVRQLLFFNVISIISSRNDPVSLSSLIPYLLVWQTLALADAVSSYLDLLQTALIDRVRSIIQAKALESYLNSHYDINESWNIGFHASQFADRLSSILSLASVALGETVNLWILVRYVGWHVAIPVFVCLAQQVLSRLVKLHVGGLRRRSRVRSPPKFWQCFHRLAQNLRTIKFYAWDRIFGDIRGQFDKPTYHPPLLWRIISLALEVAGSAISQIAALLTLTSALDDPSKMLDYAGVYLLIGSISSLTAFTARLSEIYQNVTDLSKSTLFFRALTRKQSQRYILHRIDQHESCIAVELRDCRFSWGDDKFALQPMSLQISRGELVMVVGRVGSGKSSLLEALCGEMPIAKGTGRIDGRIGYVSQKPWIMNETLRENVVMGAPYDERLFERVIEASALTEDIRQLPAGDLTEIGENGINLSGGQKARLALARALYLQADIYIFDDLLSAVDARVERQIVERVLALDGIIGNRTRILVTHAEHLLTLADTVVTLDGGHASISRQVAIAFTPVNDPNVTTHGAEIDAEETEPKGLVQGDSGTFTLHPELSKPTFHIKRVWWFIKISGVVSVFAVVCTQALCTYMIHRIEAVRVQLILEDASEAKGHLAQQTLRNYLIFCSLLSVCRQIVAVFEDWVKRTTWSNAVSDTLRYHITESFISMPLPYSERLSYLTLLGVFTSDRYRVSNTLPNALCRQIMFGCLATLSAAIHVVRINPGLIALCLPLVAVAWVAYRQHASVTNRLEALDSTRISNASGKIIVTILLNRLIIRAHQMSGQFLARLNRNDALVVCSQYARGLVDNSYELLIVVCKEAIKSSVLAYKLIQRFYLLQHIPSGEIELTIMLLSDLFDHTTYLLRIGKQLDYPLKSLSRVYIYANELPCEQKTLQTTKYPLTDWPNSCIIEFYNYSMRYRPELDLAIRKLCFSTRRFEKIGIVGRTGAGKSSLTYAIMRMVEPASGHIKIDGVDISTIDLQYLRTQISVIPQDPVLFEGTIRDNLDPAHEYSDEQVWSAIHAGQINHLLDTPTEAYVSKETEGEDLYDIDSLDDDFDKGPWIEGVGLNKWVDYGGSNFSIGQRQLVSLCRALLWRRKIVILDEATASMDAKTDSIMQYVIRREFAECTVLTIAHRLNTVMDSDRIIVMDKGQVVEFDTPQNLLSNSASHFAQLVNSMAL